MLVPDQVTQLSTRSVGIYACVCGFVCILPPVRYGKYSVVPVNMVEESYPEVMWLLPLSSGCYLPQDLIMFDQNLLTSCQRRLGNMVISQ